MNAALTPGAWCWSFDLWDGASESSRGRPRAAGDLRVTGCDGTSTYGIASGRLRGVTRPGHEREPENLLRRIRTATSRDGPLHGVDAPFGEQRHGARAKRHVSPHARTTQPHRFPARGHRPRTPEAKGCLRAGVSRTPRSLRCSRGRSRPWASRDDRDRHSSGSVTKRRTEPR